MNKPIYKSAALAALLMVVPQLTQAAEPGRLTINADKPGVRISPDLYGIFFEEVNCAGDGGLYAELVRNRSFEDSENADHWSLLLEGDAQAHMEVAPHGGEGSEFDKRVLKFSVDNGGTRAGVVNGGYWGISINKGARYNLSLQTKGECLNGPLTATLENAAGVVYASAKTPNLSNNWQKINLSLTSNATDPSARLVISTRQAGTVWLDMVSLFPQETFKNRHNGLRFNLAKMLADMKPAFMRFPGGCWVEGDTLETASRWKRTVGDPEKRWTQWNIWGYNSTNGLGYHEYLQMCEDLGADALFVINCGMSHKGVVPMNEMGPWVQDALDALEYAIGPATSKWGAVRAQNGHPQPFSLKYIQVGNENGGAAYNERYALFYDAIKKAYPQVKIVANDWGGKPTSRPIEIIDEHYYNTPEFFMRNANKYDSYKRDGLKVYVGEYAVTQGSGAGNLRGALGEAAFMTGMERNSDVVVMSSYAPLFANVNYKKWNPDLINFDSARVYGTPSYHVQQMFFTNKGDVVLPVDLQAQEAAIEKPQLRGGIGIGTWLTHAEFKDIKVTQGDKVLYQSDFANGTPGWKLQGGNWSGQNGVLRQTNEGENIFARFPNDNWQDYTLSLKARKISGREGFLIMVGVKGEDHLWWNLGGWLNTRSAFERSLGGSKYEVGQSTSDKIETNRWYDIRLEIQGDTVKGYLDNRLVSEVKDMARPLLPLYATASRDEKTGEVITKVVNVSTQPQSLKVNVSGAPSRFARAIVLTGQPMDENTLDAPRKIAPQEKVLPAGPNYVHTFPANSVTILRIK
jgi:alpha-L-arabinofuranosidase